jgi:hypothetical protein
MLLVFVWVITPEHGEKDSDPKPYLQMKLLVIVLVFFLSACSHHTYDIYVTRTTVLKKEMYMVTNIDTVNSYFFIDCKKKKSPFNYRVISKKSEKVCKGHDIIEGENYQFIMVIPDLYHAGYFDSNLGLDECASLDELGTLICENYYVEYCLTEDLDGMCYKKRY